MPIPNDSAPSGDAPFAGVADVLARLDGLGLFHMDLTLARMEAFAAEAGLSRPPYVCVHVVGTNGKGSTCAFLESILRAHGLRTGLYASPHFTDVRERVKIDGRLIPEADFLAAANRVGPLCEKLGLTYFEFLTALALDAFAHARVDVAVLEAGLGGRYDAVAAVTRDLLCCTPIGMDHMKVLGPTLRDIARDKAGAMRPNLPVLSAPQELDALEELLSEAARCRTSFTAIPPLGLDDAARTPLGLSGAHQRANAALALAAFREIAPRLRVTPDDAAVARGLARAFLPGRLQRVPAEASGATPDEPELWLDGAHNAPGLAALGAALQELGVRPAAVVFSCFADKEPETLAPHVLALTDGPLVVPGLDVPGRASDAPAVVEALGRRAVPAASLDEALDMARDAARKAARDGAAPGPVLVCGSLYLLAEFFTKHPRLLLPPDAPQAAPEGE